jgi:sulfate adenylyltransferase subunit 1
MSAPLLRFSTAGSVDDGKSTLIGRLLHDSKGIFEDQLQAVARTSERRGLAGPDLALLTDGLIAEREQGITIDVAYRYFATPKRKFIIADTPGHEQYTRNMVTGASTADLTIVLVDAVRGLQLQSRRHAVIASLLRIPHLIVAINKMDAVGYSEARYTELVQSFQPFIAALGFARSDFIPLAALQGDNVVRASERMPWYGGPALIDLLESSRCPVHAAPLRFPVQWVSLPSVPGAYHRGYMGRIESGSVRVGDAITIAPQGAQAKVRAIVTFDGEREKAAVPDSVTLLLDREIDVSRGDVITSESAPASVVREFNATLAWMDAQALTANSRWLLKAGTQTTRAHVLALTSRLDVVNLAQEPQPPALALNDIGDVRLKLATPIAIDDYVAARATGGFILIDEATNRTVAAGLARLPGVSAPDTPQAGQEK